MKNRRYLSSLNAMLISLLNQRRRSILLFFLSFLICSHYVTAKVLGEVNIRLRGTVVALSCIVDVSDRTKLVDLGAWPTRQLNHTGDKSTPIVFTINLEGCPAGNVSATFSGASDVSTPSLLALSEDSTAKNVAIELLDEEHGRIPLGQSGPKVNVDENGNAVLLFYANYYITADNPVPGSANSDANFTINYE